MIAVTGGTSNAHQVTIANGQTVSGAVDLGNERLAGILMPAAWTAADISFSASVDGTNFFTLTDAASATISITAPGAGKLLTLTGELREAFLAVRWIKIVSSVAQGAQRVVTLVTRSFT